MKQIGRIIDQQIREWELRETAGCSADTPHKTPICLSRDLGTGARVIARILSEKLGYTIFGRDSIDAIAADLHTQRRLIDTLDEQGRAGLERWVEGYLRGAPVEFDEYGKALIKVVRATALQGGVIFLGRGASFILGLKEAYSVRVIASRERRIRQLMEYESLEADEAATRIDHNDADRAAFVRKVFHGDLNSPQAYHLIVNVADRSLEDVAEQLLVNMQLLGFYKP